MLTWDSLARRPVPSWYEDAKLGVMIHWGPYAVPDQEPASAETLEVIARHWGRRGHYDALIRTFRQGLRDWDPAEMLAAVAASGARYLIVSAKHHDGFALWPARTKNPRRRGWQVTRDVVGELAEGARALGLKVGLYYSAGLDGTFGDAPFNGPADLADAIPRTKSYAGYVDAQWRELISRYSPSILWNDIGSPPSLDLLALFSDYYDAVPDGVVNDRFGQPEARDSRGSRLAIASVLRGLFTRRPARLFSRIPATLPVQHSDFRSLESESLAPDNADSWDCTRTLGENDDAPLPVLVKQLCDVTARGGRLLLRVVPRPDGSLGPVQAARLRGLGDWLKLNGEAIHGTRPWGEREGTTEDGIDVRFTGKGMTTYAILLGTPADRTIVLPSLRLLPYAGLRVLGSIGYTAWFQQGKDVHIRLTEPLRESPAHVISITPQPRA